MLGRGCGKLLLMNQQVGVSKICVEVYRVRECMLCGKLQHDRERDSCGERKDQKE